MFDAPEIAVKHLQSLLSSFDLSSVADRDVSATIYETGVRLERLASAFKNLAVERMADLGGWRGARSPAHFMAAKESKPVNHCAYVLMAVEYLHALPKVQSAYRSGALNEPQVMELVSAAAADPSETDCLLAAVEYKIGRSSGGNVPGFEPLP